MKILIIDDEDSMRHMLSVLLNKEGYLSSTCESAESALKLLASEGFDFILCDIRMPGMGGVGFLKKLKQDSSEQTVIMMSAYGTMEDAIECMKLGAYDFVSKPFKTDEILLTIKKAEERERLKREIVRLKKESRKEANDIITKDPVMEEIIDMVSKISDYSTTVLVTGESGTGKELIARAIHFTGARSKGPFVAVNCGAIPAQLLESELFGYVKGAFTNALKDKTGLFQEAQGGTLFLDEVGELPVDLQVKLLRAIEEKEVRRVGETRVSKIDVRIVSATARDLSSEVERGNFREDLFYRLNVITLKLPPLRERRVDIPLIAEFFTRNFAKDFAKPIKGISGEAMDKLIGYAWPGNVRELENVIERAVILEENPMITPASFPFKGVDGSSAMRSSCHSASGLSIKRGAEALEYDLITKALKETGGNKSKAARLLEISHRALLYKIKNYKL